MAKKKTDNELAYLPTPAQIAEECRIFQMSWNVKQERSRRVGSEADGKWELPRLQAPEEFDDLNFGMDMPLPHSLRN